MVPIDALGGYAKEYKFLYNKRRKLPVLVLMERKYL